MLPTDTQTLRDIADLKTRLGRLEVYVSRALQSDIDATGDITLTTNGSQVKVDGQAIRGWDENTLAASGTVNTGAWYGMLMISNATDNGTGLFSLNGPGGTLATVFNNALTINLTDTGAANLAVYVSGTDVIVKNRYATAKVVRVMLLAAN